MIKITQVTRNMGQVVLTIEYDWNSNIETINIDAEHVVERLKQLRGLLGRKPTLSEAQEIVETLINELRAGKQPLVEILPWENYIGVDLEAS